MPLVDEILVCFGWCLVGLKSLWNAAVKKKADVACGEKVEIYLVELAVTV